MDSRDNILFECSFAKRILCPIQICASWIILAADHSLAGPKVPDMTKRAGRVRFGSGQSGYGSNGSQVKTGHFKRVKNRFGSIGLRVGSS